jgi:hypothetical protein
MLRIIVAIVALSTIFISCTKIVGMGPNVTEVRTITNFSAINLEMDATVNIIQSNEFKVELMAQSNLMKEILTSKSVSTLTIKHRNDITIRNNNPITITISMPTINGLNVTGSGDVNLVSALNGVNLNLDVNGSGAIRIPKIVANELVSEINGSGGVTIDNGIVTTAKSSISGSGKLDMINVQAQTVNAKTSGSGATKVHADSTLNVRISGSGHVYYKGYPSITKSILGSGNVINQN